MRIYTLSYTRDGDASDPDILISEHVVREFMEGARLEDEHDGEANQAKLIGKAMKAWNGRDTIVFGDPEIAEYTILVEDK